MEKQKILIVDDSTDLRESMAEILEIKGYDTLIADSGKTAIEIALAQHPNLILLDLRMPDIDGFEVIRTLRKDEWGKNAKILILTASGESDEIPDAIEMKTRDFLLKTEWGLHNISERIEEKLTE